MDIYDFCNLCSDDSVTVAIYDYTTGEEVYKGELREAAFGDFGDYEIVAIDLVYPNIQHDVSIILNIETESEEEDF